MQQICKEGIHEVADLQKRGPQSKKFGNLCIKLRPLGHSLEVRNRHSQNIIKIHSWPVKPKTPGKLSKQPLSVLGTKKKL